MFLKEGSVSGIPASLLNEGASRGMDEIVLFVSRTTEADFHATALVPKSISRLVSGVHCDISSLMGEAEGVANKIKEQEKSELFITV